MATLKRRGGVGVSALALGLSVAIASPIPLVTSAVLARESKKSKAAEEPVDVFADLKEPLSLQLKTLDVTWKRLTLDKNAAEAAPSFLFGFSGLLESAFRSNVYYTQGKTVSVNNQNYLVVYRPEGSEVNLAALMQAGNNKNLESLRKELTPDSVLILSLINLNTIESMRDIQIFNLQREIEDSKNAIPSEPESESQPQPPKPSSFVPVTPDGPATS
ncbi:MAG: hypothetical protein ACFCU8_09950 [Thermosynechococcaceae cyanobacterium]